MAWGTISPYIGPMPFQQGDSSRFFGRDAEINDLLSLVIANRTVLFYSPSGAGKTSLLQAGLIPALENEGFEVLPVARVSGAPTGPLAAECNIFAFNVLRTWDKAASTEALVKMTFASYLRQRSPSLDESGQPAPRVLILDQFEEFFHLYPDRRNEQEDFFAQLHEAMMPKQDRRLRILFSMREEYIGQLIDGEHYAAAMPDHIRTRYRMERLTQAQAVEAITRPPQRTEPKRIFHQEAAQALAARLAAQRVLSYADKTVVTIAGDHIEGVQLQVVCRRLWAMLPPQRSEITLNDVEQIADIDRALQDFYEDALQTIIAELGIREGDLRLWIERNLITVSGTRGLIERGIEATDGLPNRALDVMEDRYLIRGDQRRPGSIWIELTHDRLLEPIQQSNRLWGEQHREAELARRSLIAAAAERTRGGDLLTGRRLRETLRWTRANPTEFSQLDASTRAFFAQSMRRFLMRIALIAAAILVGAGVLGARRLISANASTEQAFFPAATALLSEDNQPIRVEAFRIDRTEVSIGQYRRCVEYGGCSDAPLLMIANQPDEMPVTWVTYSDAVQFCQWLGRRLPTVAEWERAARGTDGRRWTWGDSPPSALLARLPFPENGVFPDGPAAVAGRDYQAGDTPEGIRHLVGNVSEWTGTPSTCASLYSCDSQAQAGAYEVRGFSFADDIRIYDSAVPLSVANSYAVNNPLDSLGFRCASNE